MAESFMQRLRPLNLTGRRHTEAAIGPPPAIALPPLPSPTAASDVGSDAVSAYEVRAANLQRNPYEGIVEPDMPAVPTRTTSGGNTIPIAPTPVPPFRLLAPSVVGPDPSPSPTGARPLSMWSEAPAAPRLGTSAATSATRVPLNHASGSFDMGRERRLTLELRSRPLGQSEYGRLVTNLLTRVWHVAPSGLAATVFDEQTPDETISAAASAINLLVCGCEAFKNVSAGVLAIQNIAQLNRLLVKSGLSPIVPQEMPVNWPPMAARQPPDFLVAGFRTGSTRLTPEGFPP